MSSNLNIYSDSNTIEKWKMFIKKKILIDLIAV